MLQQNTKWDGAVNVITGDASIEPNQFVNEIKAANGNLTIEIPSLAEALQMGDVVSYLFFASATVGHTITWAIKGAISGADSAGWTHGGLSAIDPTNAISASGEYIVFTYYYGKLIVRTTEYNA